MRTYNIISVPASSFTRTSGSGGDYNGLRNKPKINGAVLQGDMSAASLDLVTLEQFERAATEPISHEELMAMWGGEDRHA